MAKPRRTKRTQMPKGITHNIIMITPTLAAKYFEANVKNRPIGQEIVRKYSGIMVDGDWQFNGDTLRIDVNGRILDGQHRLLAIIDSGIAQPMLVVTGLQTSAFDTIDIGKSRTLSGFLAINGAPNSTTASGMMSHLLSYNSGGSALCDIRRLGAYKTQGSRIDYYLQHKADIDAATDFAKHNRTMCTGISKTMIAFLYYIMVAIDYKDATKFFAAYDGDPTIKIPAAVYIRGRMFNNINATRQTVMRPTVKLAIFIKAWNMFRDHNQTPKSLQFTQAGPGKEAFPRAI